MLHEVHNELEPVPTDLAATITEWVHRQIGTGAGANRVSAESIQSRL
jgi:hypothetical protein